MFAFQNNIYTFVVRSLVLINACMRAERIKSRVIVEYLNGCKIFFL